MPYKMEVDNTNLPNSENAAVEEPVTVSDPRPDDNCAEPELNKGHSQACAQSLCLNAGKPERETQN